MLNREIEQSSSSREARDTLGIGSKGSQESMEEAGRSEGIPGKEMDWGHGEGLGGNSFEQQP